MTDDADTAERLNRWIGRLGALNDCVEVVNASLESGEGLDPVLEWLQQSLDEAAAERDMIRQETGF
ncbi:MAG: hypothetical protein EON87_00965 [Brevundimonas sp.]|nr:MAG: hypothetical protein EON87_00965 [Brevundimonas sp.]